MALERFIDLQLIKPLSKGSANKGKISLINLFKEYFDKLNVGYLDPCCPDGSPGAFGCPAISNTVGNTITCNSDGLYSSGGGSTLTADTGLTITSNVVQFGQTLAAVGNPASLTSNRQIPMNGAAIYWTGTTGKHSFGYVDTTISAVTTLDVKGNIGVLASNVSGYPTALNAGVGATSYVVHGSGSWGLNISKPGAAGNYGAVLSFYKTSGATTDVKLAVIPGEPIARIVYQAVAADNITVATAASINCRTASTTANVVRGYLSFTTSGSDGFIDVSKEKMTLSAEGNVTIGVGITTLGESDSSKLRVHQALTDSDAFSGIHLSSTWATTGAPTAFKVDITDSSSDAASLLIDLQVAATSKFKISKIGNVGISLGATTPTALIHLAAGTATASTAPLKFTAGTNLTTPENGAVEFDGTNLYLTVGGVRKTFTLV